MTEAIATRKAFEPLVAKLQDHNRQLQRDLEDLISALRELQNCSEEDFEDRFLKSEAVVRHIAEKNDIPYE